MSSTVLPLTNTLSLTRAFNIEKIRDAMQLADKLQTDRVLILLKYHYVPVFYVEQWFCTYYGTTYQIIYYDKCAFCNQRFCECMSKQCVFASQIKHQSSTCSKE